MDGRRDPGKQPIERCSRDHVDIGRYCCCLKRAADCQIPAVARPHKSLDDARRQPLRIQPRHAAEADKDRRLAGLEKTGKGLGRLPVRIVKEAIPADQHAPPPVGRNRDGVLAVGVERACASGGGAAVVGLCEEDRDMDRWVSFRRPLRRASSSDAEREVRGRRSGPLSCRNRRSPESPECHKLPS